MLPAQIDDPRILAGMRKQMTARQSRLAAGDRRLGWKAGFGAPPALAKFGLDGPLVGYLLQSGRLESGATVSLAGWAQPIAEPEIAVHMGAALGADADEATARAAIAGIGPAFELVDVTFPPEDVEAVLAGNIFQRHVVLGPVDHTRAGANIEGLAGRVLRDGAEIAATTTLEANTGRIVDTVRRVAVMAAQLADGLQAGDVIITGSVVRPIPIGANDRELAFQLGSAGHVSVRFTHC